MANQELFPVGHLVETRSFQRGYRGAWFNCKIIQKKSDAVSLKYCDFPEERLHWTKLYQKPQGRKPIGGEKELMMRPCFPPIYHESQLPNASTMTGVAVVVKDIWCVGDLVDWWTDDCYWSGKITEVLGNEKYKIELLPHPFGEGASYEGSSNQLRPSLEWSPEEGWTLPNPPPIPGWKNCRSPARLINPVKQEGSIKTGHAVDTSEKEVQEKTEMGKELLASKETKTAEKPGIADVKDGGVKKTSFFGGISSLQARKASMEVVQKPIEKVNQCDSGPSKKIGNDGSIPLNPMSNPVEAAAALLSPVGLEQRGRQPLNVSVEDIKKSETDANGRGKQSQVAVNIDESSGHPDTGPSKKMKTDGYFSLNFANSNSIKDAILDLEDLVNKVKWIKGILQFGLPNTPPSWKFIEHRASSIPK